MTPTHVLRTHSHADHVAHEGELGLPVVRGSLEVGQARDRGDPDAGPLRRHGLLRRRRRSGRSPATRCSRMRSAAATSSEIKSAVLDVYMSMPHDRRVLPGHTDETTIGREWEHNPFVRVWRGVEPEGDGAGACRRTRRDADRLVARLRRQGQGVGALRRRRRRDRRRLTGGARLMDIRRPARSRSTPSA